MQKPVVIAAGPRTELTRGAEYTTSVKALRKWSHERLRLTIGPDLDVEARFRFDGTTCSNLGHPLVFDYDVHLDPPSTGYRIRSMACAPASGDHGIASMCRYIKDSESLVHAVATEAPLLGHPLDDVLGWKRRFSPTGCYCDAAGRSHKWGLVLEVLHFALVQLEKKRDSATLPHTDGTLS